MHKSKVKVGARVILADTSLYYHQEGDSSNPRDVLGVIEEVFTDCLRLYIQVLWGNGASNCYNHEDLQEFRTEESLEVRADAKPKTRILLSETALPNLKEPESIAYIVDVEDILNLPAEILSARVLVKGSDLKSVLSQSLEPVHLTFQETSRHPYIYTMFEGAVYQLVDKPNIAGFKQNKQLEVGAVYRVTKGSYGDISEGDIVTLLKQEPEGYQGEFPYNVQKVNTDCKSWVDSSLVLKKV